MGLEQLDLSECFQIFKLINTDTASAQGEVKPHQHFLCQSSLTLIFIYKIIIITEKN